MKIDKNTINMLMHLGDDALWQTICAIAANSGIDLRGKKNQPADMAKVRDALASITDADISRAMEILEIYRNGNAPS